MTEKHLSQEIHGLRELIAEDAQELVELTEELADLEELARNERHVPNARRYKIKIDHNYHEVHRPEISGEDNYRSVPQIVSVANSLANRNDKPNRSEPATDNGTYFLPFGVGEEGKLIAAFEAAVQAAGLKLGESAIVCRAAKKKQALRNLGQEYGQGVTKLFVSATMARDLARDYDQAFRLTTYAVVALLKNPPQQFSAGVLDPSRFPQFRDVRKIIWEFTRNADQGLPTGLLPMQSTWHPKLFTHVKALLGRLLSQHQLASQDNLSMRLKKTGLPVTAIVDTNTEQTVIDAALRVETIHGVKGESLDAVLYLADRDHVKAMVSGTGTELGRIGYVAVTRARDLFGLGLLKSDADVHRGKLLGHGFQERQYDAQLDLPLASTS